MRRSQAASVPDAVRQDRTLFHAGAEGFQDPLRDRYPIQLIGWHTKRRCHSIHDNNPELEKLDPQRLWLHPKDAAARGITNGDAVEVFNERGRTRTVAFVTEDILPGVAALAQGAWYDPDETGVDRAGSINVLTSWDATPLARGPGVAALAQGAWYDPDETGADRAGSINVLTSWDATPLARGNPQHTNLVQIKRTDP